jgi:hypothetical protein
MTTAAIAAAASPNLRGRVPLDPSLGVVGYMMRRDVSDFLFATVFFQLLFKRNVTDCMKYDRQDHHR